MPSPSPKGVGKKIWKRSAYMESTSMKVLVHAVGRPEVAPLEMPVRFRHEITYFASEPGTGSAPASLGDGEWWVSLDEAKRVFDDGVIRLVSPLDSSSTAELELTEDHEVWLEWVIANEVQHIRLK